MKKKNERKTATVNWNLKVCAVFVCVWGGGVLTEPYSYRLQTGIKLKLKPPINCNRS